MFKHFMVKIVVRQKVDVCSNFCMSTVIVGQKIAVCLKNLCMFKSVVCSKLFLCSKLVYVQNCSMLQIVVIIVYSAKKAKLNNGLPTTNNLTYKVRYYSLFSLFVLFTCCLCPI